MKPRKLPCRRNTLSAYRIPNVTHAKTYPGVFLKQAPRVRRAQISLQADTEGPNWTDAQIAEAYRCRTMTVENIRQRFVERGFEERLNRKRRDTPPTPKLLDGNQVAKILATRLGSAPDGYANWTCICWHVKSLNLRWLIQTAAKQFARRLKNGMSNKLLRSLSSG